MKDRMRWDCGKDGCYREQRMFRLTLFDDCFYSTCGMTDIDGCIDQFQRLLFVEFKPLDGVLPEGQRRLFEAATRASDKITVFVAQADAATGQCYALQTVRRGAVSDWSPCNLEGLKAEILAWKIRAQREHALEISHAA